MKSISLQGDRQMRRAVAFGVVALIAVGTILGSARAAGVGEGKSFKGPTGLQLYSLRNMFKEQGVPATLDKVQQWGFKYVEGASSYGMKRAEFRAELEKRGLQWISAAFPYNRLRDDIDGVVREAKEMGVPFVGCAYIPHKKPFDEKQCRDAAAVFNHAGKALAEQGLTFYYHNHGYEFFPYGDGTLFDLLAAETDPRYVSFEMDVLWTFHPGQDPAKLLQKYPDRWRLLHLKDLRKGVPTGLDAGKVAPTDDVAVGTGQVDWPSLLRVSQKLGVKYYFIEDESPAVVEQVPQSLRFLEQLEF
jgi:sugar phosphate isomerase/epimerase